MNVLFLIYWSLDYLKEIKNIHCYCNVLFLYLYFLFGLSLRNTSNALEPFKDENRSYVSVLWNWIQRFGSCQIYNKHRRISAFIIDETIIQIGDHRFCVCICIEPIRKSVLGIHISQKKKHVCSREFYSFFG